MASRDHTDASCSCLSEASAGSPEIASDVRGCASLAKGDAICMGATSFSPPHDAKDSSQKYVKLLVPQLVAGTLIGKGGKGLNWFRRKSGVMDLFVSLPDELFPGTDQRVVVLMGKQKAITKGLSVIIDLIAEKEETQMNQIIFRLAVPRSSVHLISARRNVRSPHSHSVIRGGAHVLITESSAMDFKEVLCVVTGDIPEVRNSCKIVAVEIQADSSLQHHTNVSYNVNAPFSFPCLDGLRFNSSASSSWSATDTAEPTTPHFEGAAPTRTAIQLFSPSCEMASGPPSDSTWDSLPSLDTSISTTPNMATISTSFAGDEPDNPQMSEEGTSYGSCACPSAPPSPEEVQHRLRSNSVSRRPEPECKSMGGVAGAYNGGNRPPTVSSSCNLKLDLPNLALLLKDRKDILNFFTVIETRVPASVAGAIIGSHGRYIREIQDMSGATVNVSRENDPSSSTDSRTLQILGTVEAVYSAYALCIGRVLKGR